ncbi:MAG: hypothetical protein PHI12_09160 [Dehalococcoidales bacterium]|nr:hypothetical protein [Dehalococcoidales bacterium]
MKKIIERLQGTGAVDKEFLKTLDKMSDMEDRNDHNGFVIEAAKLVGLKKIAQAMEHVSKIHMLLGGMSVGLIEFRREMSGVIRKEAQNKLSPEEYEAFSNVF